MRPSSTALGANLEDNRICVTYWEQIRNQFYKNLRSSILKMVCDNHLSLCTDGHLLY